MQILLCYLILRRSLLPNQIGISATQETVKGEEERDVNRDTATCSLACADSDFAKAGPC